MTIKKIRFSFNERFRHKKQNIIKNIEYLKKRQIQPLSVWGGLTQGVGNHSSESAALK